MDASRKVEFICNLHDILKKKGSNQHLGHGLHLCSFYFLGDLHPITHDCKITRSVLDVLNKLELLALLLGFPFE